MYLVLLKSAVHGYGRGKRLGTSLVLQLHESCVVSLQYVPVFQCASCERLKMLAVHSHGRGTCLCTCLVYAACVVAFVACVNGDEFSLMYLILLHQFCMGVAGVSITPQNRFSALRTDTETHTGEQNSPKKELQNAQHHNHIYESTFINAHN